MAQRVEIILEDDLDGGLAAGTVSFAFDGISYEIDLSEANEQRLRDQLAPWIAHARRPVARDGARKAKSTGPTGSEIRAWAKARGMRVNARGRVPAEVRAAYEAEHR